MDPCLWNDLNTICRAMIEQQVSKLQQVASRNADAACTARRALLVNRDQGIGICTHGMPQQILHDLRIAGARAALQYDSKQIRIGREIPERTAMWSGALGNGEKHVFERFIRPAGQWRIPKGRPSITGIIAVLVEIFLAEINVGAHIQQMLQGAITIAT